MINRKSLKLKTDLSHSNLFVPEDIISPKILQLFTPVNMEDLASMKFFSFIFQRWSYSSTMTPSASGHPILKLALAHQKNGSGN